MKLIMITAALLLVGCAAPTIGYKPKETAVSEPPIGVISTASVGDKMVTQGVFVEQEGLEVLSPFNPTWAYTIGAGSYLKIGEAPDQEFFTPKYGSGGGIIEKKFLADPWKSVMLKANGELCIVTVFNASTCDKNAAFEKRKFNAMTERSFQQTLIYSGKSGNKINVGYREFASDLARMAFNNNVEYDLSESMTIGYKGAEIEVLEATNRFIKFKVIKNFNSGAR